MVERDVKTFPPIEKQYKQQETNHDIIFHLLYMPTNTKKPKQI